jgi:hypothetical protein
MKAGWGGSGPLQDAAPLVDSVASIRPGKLLLRTGGACDFDPEHLLDVFGE